MQVSEVLGSGPGYFKLSPSPGSAVVDPGSGALQQPLPLQVSSPLGPLSAP